LTIPTLAALAAAWIAVEEGPARLVAYQDPGGVWTIGQGHTAGVKEGDTCTLAQSVAWFAEDQARLFAIMGQFPWHPLKQAAFVDFGYNCGLGALEKVLNATDVIWNPVYTHDAAGNVEPGLVSRRTFERLVIACFP